MQRGQTGLAGVARSDRASGSNAPRQGLDGAVLDAPFQCELCTAREHLLLLLLGAGVPHGDAHARGGRARGCGGGGMRLRRRRPCGGGGGPHAGAG